jgi:phosphatidylglycerol:prolipoprotein diacylglycerol transferase
MFIHNINPTLLSLGPFEIRFYGLVYVFAFIALYIILKKKKESLGINEKQIDDFLFYIFIGMLLGARLFHVFFWEPNYYLSNFVEIFKVWKGGLSFHGGLLGGGLLGVWYCKKHHISVPKMADIVVLPAAFFLALGRIANFINGELWGNVTNVNWCVVFPRAEGCRHPSQLYAAFTRFVIFGVLYVIDKKERKDGYLFWWFVILMGLGRIFVDFYRENARFIFLSMGQWLSFVMVIVGFYVLRTYYRER